MGFGLTLVVLGSARALTTGIIGGIAFLAATVLPLVVIVVVLVTRRPKHPAPWYLISTALVASVLHNVQWFVEVYVQGQAQTSGVFPTFTLLLGYAGLLAAAIVVVIPVARGDGGVVVDAAIVSVSVAGLLWTLVLSPSLDGQNAGPQARWLTLVTVLLVCGTTGAITRAAFTARQARPSLGYLVLAAVAMLLATILPVSPRSAVSDDSTLVTDLIWIVAFLALAAAASHPSRSALQMPGRIQAQTLTLPHLLVLGSAMCSNLFLAGVLELTGTGADPALLIAGSLVVVPLFLLRVWQIAGLFEAARAELVRQTEQDELTGLANRRAATAHLTRTVRDVDDGSLEGARVCFLDLDGFKKINDDHGHGAGDLVLVEAARRLRTSVRHDDFVARFGGDEFVVVLPCDADDLEELTVNRIRSALAEPITIGPATIVIDVSIGSVAVRRSKGLSVEQLLSLADSRMYLDKGRDRSPR